MDQTQKDTPQVEAEKVDDPNVCLRQFVDYHFALLCRACGAKVLDPDKKRNQTHLKGKCPTCGKDSVEEKKQSKKKSKKERRAERLACRAKY